MVGVVLHGIVVGILFRNPEDVDSPYVSPMLTVSYAGLPRTLIATADFDGLRIEGEVYGSKLAKAGVNTRIIRYMGVNHGFFDHLGIIPQAEDLVLEIAKDLKSL
jgi:acetyl esterase/lipase